MNDKISIRYFGDGIATITGWRLFLFLYFLYKSLVGLIFGRIIVKYTISENSIFLVDLNGNDKLKLTKQLLTELKDVVEKLEHK